jgi:hypothetical protein
MSLLNDDVRQGSRRDGHARRRLRRALRAQDRVSARLAELFWIDEVLADAAGVVGRGWLQHGWFTYVDPAGRAVTVTACSPRTARRLAAQDVTGACLVGAIIHAAGGPPRARSQLVQRSIELVWHASFRRPREPIGWCRSSQERAGHAIDLVYWNDSPGRTVDDVVGALAGARDLLRGEVDRARSRKRSIGEVVAGRTVGGRS